MKSAPESSRWDDVSTRHPAFLNVSTMAFPILRVPPVTSTVPFLHFPFIALKKQRNPHPAGRRFPLLDTLRYGLGFGLSLLKTKTAAILFPFATLLKQIDTLKALQDIALGRNLAGTSKTAMLTHFLFSFSKNVRVLYQMPLSVASVYFSCAAFQKCPVQK